MDENVSLIMMCFQGPLVLCCTSHFGYTNAVFQSIFLVFLHRFTQNCLCPNVLNFEYWHLFIACKNYWLCDYETWMKAIFSWMKNTLFCTQFSPQNTGNRILGLWNSKMFLQSMPPDLPRRRGPTAIDSATGSYSIQTCWLTSIYLLKHLMILNFCLKIPWTDLCKMGVKMRKWCFRELSA